MCIVLATSKDGQRDWRESKKVQDTDGAQTRWFTTKTNRFLHHALNAATGTALCNRTVLPTGPDAPREAGELGGTTMFCPRCRSRITTPVVDTAQTLADPAQAPVKPKRLTASQTWDHLTLLQREQVLMWFVATYAPVANAARFTLTRNASLTHAQKIIAETWRGMES